MTHEQRIRADHMERLVNPPAIMGPQTVILSPPLGNVEEYMKYLSDNREHYRRFFGVDDE